MASSYCGGVPLNEHKLSKVVDDAVSRASGTTRSLGEYVAALEYVRDGIGAELTAARESMEFEEGGDASSEE